MYIVAVGASDDRGKTNRLLPVEDKSEKQIVEVRKCLYCDKLAVKGELECEDHFADH